MAHACRKDPAAAAKGRAASEGREHDDAADKGAEQAACAAENDHDQRERQHVLVEPGIDREDRPADDAGESCKTCAEGEDNCEQLRHANADDARHVGIIYPGADHGAEPGAFEEKPKGDCDNRGNDDDRQAIVGKNKNAETRETGQFRRCCDRERVATPYDETQIRRHEGETERHQHLCQLVTRQAPQ
jgi:hypothetical protein